MQKTVFIVGAGASQEVGLPTGNELKVRIARLLDIYYEPDGSLSRGDYRIAEALRVQVQKLGGSGNIRSYQEEAWQIVKALPQASSIDSFLDTRRDNEMIELCGKLGVVSSILNAESNCHLFVGDGKRAGIDFSALEETWYAPFFRLLTTGCDEDELKERLKNITLIIFNYDRCFEHYMFHALRNFYGLDSDYASELLSHLTIYHPYGVVGTLPWAAKGQGVEFGHQPTGAELLQLTARIKTFAEGTDPKSSKIVGIRNAMAMAEKLVFLGFAFHELNMALLTPSLRGVSIMSRKCYATGFGISSADKRVIRDEIISMYAGGIEVQMAHLGCRPFFDEFWRGLNKR